MRKNIRPALVILLGAAILAAAAGCKLLRPAPPPPPTEQSFRDAVEKYFLAAGYQKAGEASYQLTQPDGALKTESIEWAPLVLVQYPGPTYTWQGIVQRKTITKLKDKEQTEPAPFIMYWNAKTRAWEHLFGKNIPQPPGQK
jgi:hypothetical protein